MTQFILKAEATEDEDGVLTPAGMQVAHDYAAAWVEGRRLTTLELLHPELIGLFHDIRFDSELAHEHVLPMEAKND